MNRWDVVVIGGGPAGAMCASMLARSGRSVLLLEAEPMPRYRVGESLSPTAVGLLVEAGVSLDGFVRKPGATFQWGRPTFTTRYGGDPERGAVQARRDELDARLLDRAVAAGATVRRCTVRRVRFDGDRAVGVAAEDADGGAVEFAARWIVDASGPAAVLATQLKLLDHAADLDHRAVWAYWQGSGRLPGPLAGGCLYLGAGTEYLWHIPVDDAGDVVSVGVVTPSTSGPGLTGDLPDGYRAAVARSGIGPLLGDATMRMPVRSGPAAGYRARRLAGAGWLLAGDAGWFVDPILTPGVQWALQSGQLAAACVDAVLAEPVRTRAVTEFYDRECRSRYATFAALAGNLYRAAGPPLNGNRPPVEVPTELDDGDRIAFFETISGLRAPQLPVALGAHLTMRARAVRFGGHPPVFGEVEGFRFLTRLTAPPVRPTGSASLRPDSVLRVAPGVSVADEPFVPAAPGGGLAWRQAVRNGAGDRFAPTAELCALLDLLRSEPDCATAVKRFAADFEVSDDAAVVDWLELLGRHGLIEWQSARFG